MWILQKITKQMRLILLGLSHVNLLDKPRHSGRHLHVLQTCYVDATIIKFIRKEYEAVNNHHVLFGRCNQEERDA